jgi:hypothetical protein
MSTVLYCISATIKFRKKTGADMLNQGCRYGNLTFT